MKIGWIGAGLLGKAMMKRLLNKGVDIVAWNRTLEKLEGLDAK
nr:NAD(P)-binding domain-containing protein [Thermosulfidibacter takaii]